MWRISEGAFQNWVGGRERELIPSISLDRATVQNLILLALVENRERSLSYEELNITFIKKGVVKSLDGKKSIGIPVPTLRVAISGLAKRLSATNHFYELHAERVGKAAQFSLVDRSRGLVRGKENARTVDEPLIQPKDITRRLVMDGGGLSFASSYCCARAAAHWLHFSAFQAESKKEYEAEAFDAYGLSKAFRFQSSSRDIGIVSLATGEGLGEVELLERLLRAADRPRPRRVQYIAIDTSEFLLNAHSNIIRERFEHELSNGTLLYAPFVGNLYRLQRCLEALRLKWGGELARGVPILCTYYGNCLGNFENHEWEFFRAVADAFPEQDVSILLGISVARKKGEKRNGPLIEETYYTLDSFYLETPRHLMYDLKLLRSEQKVGKRIDPNLSREFREIGTKSIPAHRYDTKDGILGSVYRFNYELKHDLVTWDGSQRLSQGRNLLLYSIVKYDLISLRKFLESRGLRVQMPPDCYHVQRIVDKDGDYRYAVIAVSM